MNKFFRVFVGSALLVSGLSVGEISPSMAQVPPSQSVSAKANPAAPAYVAEIKPEIEGLLKEMMVPGAVVLVRSPELGDWSAAFGYRDLEKTAPITVADHFRIGSNTKTMTGTVVLQLVDEGLLKLSDPIAKYLDNVPNGKTVTIEEMLEMRSGLPTYSNSVEMNEPLDNDPLRVWELQELLDIAYREPIGTPGKEYFYSNTNFVLLGMVIEKLTGKSVEKAFQERLFAPLGMSNTILPPRSSNAVPSPHPKGYQFGTNVSTISGDALPTNEQGPAKAGKILPNEVTDENPSWGWTAGAGISTAQDLADYVEAMVGGGLLKPELQKQRLASFIPINPSEPKGLAYGWALADFGPILGHTGELPGFNSFMGYHPETKLTLIVWTNLNNAPDGRPPAVTIAKAMLAKLN